MALIKIGNVDLTDIVSYEVTHTDNTKEVKNSMGDTFIYVLGEKVTLKIKIGALEQAKMNDLINAINTIIVNVTFIDTDNIAKTKTMKRSDRVMSMRSYLNNTPYWDENMITLTEI